MTETASSRFGLVWVPADAAGETEVAAQDEGEGHGVTLLIQIEDEMDQKRQGRSEMRDVQLWKRNQNKYMSKFSSKNTWFMHATPKYE